MPIQLLDANGAVLVKRHCMIVLLFIFALYEGKNEQQYDHTVPLYQHRAIGIQQLDWHNPSNEPKYIPLTGIGLVTT